MSSFAAAHRTTDWTNWSNWTNWTPHCTPERPQPAACRSAACCPLGTAVRPQPAACRQAAPAKPRQLAGWRFIPFSSRPCIPFCPFRPPHEQASIAALQIGGTLSGNCHEKRGGPTPDRLSGMSARGSHLRRYTLEGPRQAARQAARQRGSVARPSSLLDARHLPRYNAG